MEGDVSHVVPLTIADTSRIHFRGGSCIGISRANPTKRLEHMRNVAGLLEALDVGMLLTIGGDDHRVHGPQARASGRRARLRVVHVPKTIDNDLDLPHDVWTFGYQTARAVGVEIVHNLMVDAKTTGRLVPRRGDGAQAGTSRSASGRRQARR